MHTISQAGIEKKVSCVKLSGMELQTKLQAIMKSGMTSTEIAKATGLSRSMISKMSRGLAGIRQPSHRAVEAIERLLQERRG